MTGHNVMSQFDAISESIRKFRENYGRVPEEFLVGFNGDMMAKDEFLRTLSFMSSYSCESYLDKTTKIMIPPTICGIRYRIVADRTHVINLGKRSVLSALGACE